MIKIEYECLPILEEHLDDKLIPLEENLIILFLMENPLYENLK